MALSMAQVTEEIGVMQYIKPNNIGIMRAALLTWSSRSVTMHCFEAVST